jgi:hypothetical protein
MVRLLKEDADLAGVLVRDIVEEHDVERRAADTVAVIGPVVDANPERFLAGGHGGYSSDGRLIKMPSSVQRTSRSKSSSR